MKSLPDLITLADGSQIDPSRIREDAWLFYDADPEGTWRRDICWIEKPNGEFPGLSIVRKVNLVEQDVLDFNKHQFDESQTKRFGDGQSVARMPLNVFYRDFAPRLKEGDKDFTKWWLNQDDNRPYRNFRGKF